MFALNSEGLANNRIKKLFSTDLTETRHLTDKFSCVDGIRSVSPVVTC
jgi:hypothetical protein